MRTETHQITYHPGAHRDFKRLSAAGNIVCQELMVSADWKAAPQLQDKAIKSRVAPTGSAKDVVTHLGSSRLGMNINGLPYRVKSLSIGEHFGRSVSSQRSGLQGVMRSWP
jgi:hypothetical protein